MPLVFTEFQGYGKCVTKSTYRIHQTRGEKMSEHRRSWFAFCSVLLSSTPPNICWILSADPESSTPATFHQERFNTYRGLMQIFKAPNPVKKYTFLFLFFFCSLFCAENLKLFHESS